LTQGITITTQRDVMIITKWRTFTAPQVCEPTYTVVFHISRLTASEWGLSHITISSE